MTITSTRIETKSEGLKPGLLLTGLHNWAHASWSPLSSPVAVPLHFSDLSESHLMAQQDCLRLQDPSHVLILVPGNVSHTHGGPRETLIERVNE